jgi:hypothetical protein
VALFGARWYLDRQWYVGSSDGHVAIFQGIPLSILGYELGHPETEFDGLPTAEVTELVQYSGLEQGIAFGSYDEAEEHVEQIRDDVEAARRQEQREQREAQQGGNGQ